MANDRKLVLRSAGLFLAAALVFGAAAAKADDAKTFYEARYSITGFLLRSAMMCEGDNKRTVDAAFGLVGNSQLRAISKGFPKATEQWMNEGAQNFNAGVMTDGLEAACSEAASILSRTEQMIKTEQVSPSTFPE